MGLFKTVKGYGIVKFLESVVDAHPAEEYAKDAANEIRKIVENEVGNKRANMIRDTIVPWVDRFYVTFRKTLLDN